MNWKIVQGPPREVHELRLGGRLVGRVQDVAGWAAHIYDPQNGTTVANSAHADCDAAKEWVEQVLVVPPSLTPKTAAA